MGAWATFRRRLWAVAVAALGTFPGGGPADEVRSFQHWAVVERPGPADGPVQAMMVSASVTGTGFLAVRCRRSGVQFMADWLRPPPPTRYAQAWLRVDDGPPRMLAFRRTGDPSVTFLEPFPAGFQQTGRRARIPDRATVRNLLEKGRDLVIWIRSVNGHKERLKFSLSGFAAAYSRMLQACQP